MKKALIVSYTFPPSNAVAVHRILRISKWLPENGWDPIILTTRYLSDDRVNYENVTFVRKYISHVFRCGGGFDRILFEHLRTRRRFLFKGIKSIILDRLVPDSFVFWFFTAIKQGLKIIQSQKVDLIFASIGGLKTNALVGAYLKKRTGLPLMIDYRDPWNLSHFNRHIFVKQRLNIFFEKNVLRLCDRISTTSALMKELFVEHRYFEESKIDVITNGFDEELQFTAHNFERVDLDKTKINITYTGTFYGDRQPYSFIEGLSLLIKERPEMKTEIAVNFVGNWDNDPIKQFCQERSMLEVVKFFDMVPYKKAMKYLMESDILLLINGLNKLNRIYIPAKMFDYLVVKKPILFIGNCGAPAEIIRQVNIGVICSHDPEEIKSKLVEMLEKRDSYKIRHDAYLQYSAKMTTQRLAMAFDLITND